MPKLGVLERVDPHVIWVDEAKDFTPWLVENIRTLSDALGMDLEVAESEEAVGGFRVDIVCNDLATGRPVVIENILGSTDHDHLGKLITRLTGNDPSWCDLQRETIAYIAEKIARLHSDKAVWQRLVDVFKNTTNDAE